MGIRWRRLNERVKQRLGMAHASFLITTNRRCEMMFEEASHFAVHLRRMESTIKKLQENAEEMMVDTRNIMLCSLPCTFDYSPSGQAVPEDPEPQIVGQNVKLDRFSVAMQTVRQKMEEEVMEPLRSWLQAFNNADERMKKLESLRLELDSRRRTVEGLKDKVEKQKTMLDSGNLRSPSVHELSLKKLLHKEEKKNSTQSSFQSYESEVYKILYTLNKDTACLRDYTALAYNILTEAFGAAESAFLNNGMLINSTSLGTDITTTSSNLHGRRHSSAFPVSNTR